MKLDRRKLATALIIIVPALFAAAIMARELILAHITAAQLSDELSEIDIATQKVSENYPPSPCDLAVHALMARCEGQVEDQSADDALASCKVGKPPWDCVRECVEKETSCQDLPSCVVQCTESGGLKTDIAKDTKADMAFIPGGWSVLRLVGPRWETRFKIIYVAPFAMDKYEFPNKKGIVPVAGSWQKAKDSCEAIGKRLCTWAEWQKVCGQAEGLKYPFGDKYDCTKCSFPSCVDPENLKPGKIHPSGAFPECRGRYGVYDLAGNLSEFIADKWGPWDQHRMVTGGSYNINDQNDQKQNADGKWEFVTYSSECSAVHHHAPDVTHEDDGFRCCLDAGDPLAPLMQF